MILVEGALLPTCPDCHAPVYLARHLSGAVSAFDSEPHDALGLWELAMRMHDGIVIATYAGRGQNSRMHHDRSLRVLSGWYVPHVTTCRGALAFYFDECVPYPPERAERDRQTLARIGQRL